jgi:hypothetical protein
MQKPIPWKAPAMIAVKRRGEDEYQPAIAGLTLNSALEYAADPDRPAKALRIWVYWQGQEIWIAGRRILELASDPDRPAPPTDWDGREPERKLP